MPTPAIYAPWRMDYIRSLTKSPGDDKCFLCEASKALDEASRRKSFVLWQTEHVLVMLNRYPYANGHLLVAPKNHKADLEELSEEESADLVRQTTKAVQLLKRAVSAQGFNIGMNLGRIAGAGVPGHLHQHVVPRWGGDINFMQVVGNVSVVPEANERMYEELLKQLNDQ